jgi:nucleoside-diphosphate-sugar epimerase
VPFTILRPTIVYGRDVKGTFGTLVRIAARPWPLPFARLTNRRSLLGIDNLVDAIQFVLSAPMAKGETYVVADPHPLTLPEIVAALREAAGQPPRVFGFPSYLLENGLRLLGRQDIWHRLGGALVVNPAKLMSAGWRPPVETTIGLEKVVRPVTAGL